MINTDTNPFCKQAEIYYYDILFGKGDNPVPASIIDHVENCHNCQEQLKWLEAELSKTESDDTENEGSDSVTAAILQLHLAHSGKIVTCDTVRPFLPTLLSQALKVGIPTPITVHVDKCKACAEDLQTIRQMNLSSKQLNRLSRFFADNASEDTVSCSEVKDSGQLRDLLSPDACNAAVLRHVCLCDDCRQAVYQCREDLRGSLLREEGGRSESACEQATAGNIFDYCVPYGIDPTSDGLVKSHESFASHLLSCPACIGKMQQLYNAVCAIAQRSNSEIATIYRIAGASEIRTQASPDGPYAGFPIKVEVADGENEAESGKRAPGWRGSVIRLRPFARMAVAAAVVLILAALFIKTPSAKAITLAEIYRALENARNVYIAHFVSDRKQPIQEQWVSRDLGLYLIKTESQAVLRDIPNGQMKIRQSADNSVEVMDMSPDMISNTDERMQGSLGLVPFSELSMLPKGSTWRALDNAKSFAVGQDIEVYELIWTQESPGAPVMMRKWLFFVDVRTGLPQRVKIFQKSVDDAEYELRSIKTVEYLSDKEIQEAVNKRLSAGDVSFGQPEGIPVLVNIAALLSDQ